MGELLRRFLYRYGSVIKLDSRVLSPSCAYDGVHFCVFANLTFSR